MINIAFLLENDRGNPEVHPSHIQLQRHEVLKSCDRRGCEGEDRQLGQKQNALGQTMVTRRQVIRPPRFADQAISTDELLLHTDHGDGQLTRMLRCTAGGDLGMAALQEREDVCIQHLEAHDGSASRSTCRRYSRIAPCHSSYWASSRNIPRPRSRDLLWMGRSLTGQGSRPMPSVCQSRHEDATGLRPGWHLRR